MTAPGRLLGLDHGQKVIGVAVSDGSGLIARPLTRITRTTRAKDFEAIRRLCTEQSVVGVVVGLPETPPGFTGVSQAETARNWALRLAGQVSIPVYLWNETLSTFEAQELAETHGRSATERVDDWAAAVLLSSLLEHLREGGAFPEPLQGRKRSYG